MPYRRLPNTDNARIKALRLANEKGTDLPPFKLAFSQSMFHQVKSILPTFENAISEHRNAMNLHAEKNKDYQTRLKKAKLYISHFIQVVDMAIMRGEQAPEIRADYGLIEDERKLPSLHSEEEILSVGKALIDGERARKLKGKAPITNPTIALVQVHYDKFVEAYNFQKSLKKRTMLAHSSLEEIREKIDGIIQQTWNEVEGAYTELPEDIKREKASDYGVVYVFRKNEMEGMNLFESNNQLEQIR